MRRATQLAPRLGQHFRLPPSRAAALRIYSQHAGPSTLLHQHRSVSHVVSHVGQRRPETAPSVIGSTPPSLTPRSGDVDDPLAPDDDKASASVEEGMDEEQIEEIARAAEEGLSQSLRQTGVHLHNRKRGVNDPIILPLSSLASSHPTLAAESGLAVPLPPDVFGERLRRDILHRCVIWYQASLRRGTKKTKSRSEVAYSGHKIRPQKGTGKARLGDRGSPMLRGGGHAHAIRPKDWSQDLPRKVRAFGMRVALSSKLNMGLLRVVHDLNDGKWRKTTEAGRALANVTPFIEDGPIEFATSGAFMESEPVTETLGASDEAELSYSNEDTELGAESIPESKMTEAAEAVVEDADDSKQIASVERFGRAGHLSILFLHDPSKPLASVFAFARVVRNIPGIEILSTDEVEVWHVLKYRWLVMEGDAVDAIAQRVSPAGMSDAYDIEVSEPSTTSESGELLTQIVPTLSVEVDEERVVKVPGFLQWNIRQWRKKLGAKRIEKAVGFRRAAVMLTEAKRAQKQRQREAKRQARKDKWQRRLDKKEAEALAGKAKALAIAN